MGRVLALPRSLGVLKGAGEWGLNGSDRASISRNFYEYVFVASLVLV